MMSDIPRESRSVVITIPPRKVWTVKEKKKHDKPKTKKYVRKVVRSPSAHNLKHIAVPFCKPLRLSAMKYRNLLICRLYTRQQRKDILKRSLKYKLSERYQMASYDMSARLYCPYPEDDVRAVTTDIDDTFFTFLDNRPITQFGAQYNSLKQLYNDYLRIRQEIGYLNDCIVNIDNNERRIQKSFESSVLKCKEQVKHFNNFISYDYHRSIQLLAEWEYLDAKVDNEQEELRNLANDQFFIMSNINMLEYKYRIQQKYGRFLYYLSPPTWRHRNRDFAHSVEIEEKGFDFGANREESSFESIYETLRQDYLEGNYIEPALYFKKPEDLMYVFHTIEQQQLYNFTHVADLDPFTRSLKETIDKIRNNIRRDSTGVLQIIKYFENAVAYCEHQCEQLEAKFYKILIGLFYESVASPDVLKFKLHLDFAYERIYNEASYNQEIVGLAKSLEDCYMIYCLRLESFHSDTITTAINQYIKSERLKLKKAKIAENELRCFQKLQRRLMRAFVPPMPWADRQLARAQVVPNTIHKNVPIKTQPKGKPQRVLSKDEIEYLMFFTQWTECEDPEIYLMTMNREEYS